MKIEPPMDSTFSPRIEEAHDPLHGLKLTPSKILNYNNFEFYNNALIIRHFV